MNAQVSAQTDARIAEEKTLPPLHITERPDRSAFVAPVRKKKRGRVLLLILAFVSLGLAGYTLVQGRLVPGGFSFRTQQSTVPQPDPMQILQKRMADVEMLVKSTDDDARLVMEAVVGDVAKLRNDFANIASLDELAAVRTQIEQVNATVWAYSGRINSLENVEKQRRVAQIERSQQQQEVRTREETATLPFRVLALDRWGGKPYVTVALPGVSPLETMGVGDKRAGWELKDVDARGGNVTFVDQSGHSVKKTVEER